MIGLSCKDSSRLMSLEQDQPLTLGQRIALRLHLVICTACARVKTQLAFMRRAARDYPGPDNDDPPHRH
ncbi:MAG: zf-HC2 domain-containing protein [Betaproteobacteria bacterium]